MNATGFYRYAVLVLSLLISAQPTLAQDKPNILVIWGDDVGYDNISVYWFNSIRSS